MEAKDLDQVIEAYIKGIVAKKQQLSFTQFWNDNLQLIVDNTTGDQWDVVDRMWRAHLGDAAKKLDVTMVNDKQDIDFVRVLKFLEQQNQKSQNSKQQSNSSASPSNETVFSSSGASKNNSHMLTPEARSEFDRTYNAMKKEDKWEIRDGVYVEDIMYNFGTRATHEHPAHSFILNLSDPCWEQEFDEESLVAIRSYGNYSLPTLHSHVQELFDTYDNQPKDDVLDFLIEKTNELGPYNPRTNEDLYKLQNVIQQFVGYYLDDVFDNVKSWTEEDFVTHIWGPFDRFFHSSKIITTRNKTCLATSQRVSGERRVTGLSMVSDKKASIRPDLVLVQNGLEYGCSEIGINLSPVPDRKEIVESSLLSPRTMKDMLHSAIAKTKNDAETARKLKIVCFNQTGLTMSLSVMDSPGGYICRIVESEKYEVPRHSDLVVSQLFPILQLVLQAKMIVDDSLSVIKSYQLAKRTPKLNFENTSPKLILPPCLTTPILPAPRKRNQANQNSPAPSPKKLFTGNSKASSSS
ncbi:hypothetical protein BJV82DRAFT_614151 [Fennellomyces sp. T-0311]|nr:hypothetical protein BJV82DRAFT_614151 [Fennellomyces sp. T-0311]